MALTITDRGTTQTTAGSAVGTVTSGSLSPANGSRLVVATFLNVQSGTSGDATPTFTDSGLGLTWTRQTWSTKGITSGGQYREQVAIYTSSIVAGSPTGTITFTDDQVPTDGWMGFHAWEVAASPGVGLVVSTPTANTVTSIAFDLGSAPAASSAVFTIVHADNDSGITPAQPSGYTLSDSYLPAWGAYTGWAVKNGSAAQTGTWSGFTSGATRTLFTGAVEITDSGGTNAPAAAATGTGTAYNATVPPQPAAATTYRVLAGDEIVLGDLVLYAGGVGTRVSPLEGAAFRPLAPAAATTNAPATAATGTGAAYNASASLALNADAATGTGAANTANANVAPNAENTAGAGSAYPATVPTITSTAGAATGTGTASNPAANVAPNSGNSAGSGAANGCTGAVAPSCGAATGTGAASAPASSIAPNVGNAAGIGAAYDATVTTVVSGSANATAATGTGTAYSASAAIAARAGAATGNGTANNATVTTSVATNANANAATGTGTANNASVSISAKATAATGTGTANNASVYAAIGALLASGTATAYDPGGSVSPHPTTATGTGTAYDPSAAPPDDPYPVTLTVHDRGHTATLIDDTHTVTARDRGHTVTIDDEGHTVRHRDKGHDMTIREQHR